MNDHTLLLRQVHPSWVQSDNFSIQVFTSQTFRPTPKDDFKLSVYNGEKFSSESSYQHYASNGNVSAGVVAVTVQECTEFGLPCEEDNLPFDGHSFIDYAGLSSSAIEKVGGKLKIKAKMRGWLYLPENNN